MAQQPPPGGSGQHEERHRLLGGAGSAGGGQDQQRDRKTRSKGRPRRQGSQAALAGLVPPDTSSSAAVAGSIPQTEAQLSRRRRPRPRTAQQQDGGSAASGPLPAAAATPGPPELTWQQQLLSVEAPIFTPGGQQSSAAAQQQQEAGRRSRNRGRQRREQGPPPLAAASGTDGITQASGMQPTHHGHSGSQMEQQQQQQPRSRLPRKPKQQRQQQQALARPLATEAAPQNGGLDHMQQQQYPQREQQRRRPAEGQEQAPLLTEPPEQQEGVAHEEAPHCLVCCSEMAEVGIGRCNHSQVCGGCTLRMRLCYGNQDCPFCKQQLDEVLIAPWRPDLPSWEWFQGHPDYVARSRHFANGTILADRWRPGGRLSSRLLHDLQRRTAPACSLCDPGAQQPFASSQQLARHVREAHAHRLCDLCLQEGRLFPLEQPLFGSAEALAQHMADTHPRCDFCARSFYGEDELWKHMQQVHYSCHVCPPPVAAYAYFRGARELSQHLRQEHYACEAPECIDCFTAFASADELRRHQLERHSARMPRWDASRARPLPLDIQFVRRPGTAAAGQGSGRGDGGGGRQQRRQPRSAGSQDVRVAHSQPAEGPESDGRRWEFEQEIDGGLRVIDDQEFPAAAAAQAAAARQALAGGSWAGQQQRPRGMGGEEFPSLATAAAVAAASTPAPPVSEGGRRQPPPLVKMTARCPCGRRTANYALPEGQQPPPLDCDGVCALEGRQRQLAEAFGVEHPESHVSVFDRREPSYSGALLAAAQQQPRLIDQLERALAAFIADRASSRHSLPPAPREARGLAHALAEQYGLATRGVGQEPQRCVELIRTPQAALPRRLLSSVAATVSAEEVAALLKQAEGFPLRLDGIALSFDPRSYLRRWEGSYSLEWESSEAVVVRFEREEDLKDALNQLGGGIRGLFRVDRSWQPRTAVSGAPLATRSAGSSHGWASAATASDATGASSGSSTWTAVALAPPLQQQQSQQQQESREEETAGNGGPVRSGWAVISSRRAAKPPPAANGNGPTRQQQGLALLLPEDEGGAWSPDGGSAACSEAE